MPATVILKSTLSDFITDKLFNVFSPYEPRVDCDYPNPEIIPDNKLEQVKIAGLRKLVGLCPT